MQALFIDRARVQVRHAPHSGMDVATPVRPLKRAPDPMLYSSQSKRHREPSSLLASGGEFDWGTAFGNAAPAAAEAGCPPATHSTALKRPAAAAVFGLHAKRVRGGVVASPLAENRRPKRPMNAMDLGDDGATPMSSGKRSRGAFRGCGGGGGAGGGGLFTERQVRQLVAAETRAADDELVRLRAALAARDSESAFLKKAIIAFEQKGKAKDDALGQAQLCAFGMAARVNALESENYALRAELAQRPKASGGPSLVPDPRPPPAVH